jgi:hypothetical protein
MIVKIIIYFYEEKKMSVLASRKIKLISKTEIITLVMMLFLFVIYVKVKALAINA